MNMAVEVETVDLNAQVVIVAVEKGDWPKHILLNP